MLAHHDQQASGHQDHAAHGRDDSLYCVLPANQSDFFNTHSPLHNLSLLTSLTIFSPRTAGPLLSQISIDLHVRNKAHSLGLEVLTPCSRSVSRIISLRKK